MKKWIALLLSCVMLLAMVAGCGGTLQRARVSRAALVKLPPIRGAGR